MDNSHKQQCSEFQKKIKNFQDKGRPIVYLDKNGFEQSIPRTHAYSAIEQRCYGTHDWQATLALF